MQGSGCRVQASGVRVQGSGVRVQVSGFRVQGSGYRIQGSGFMVQSSGFRAQGSGFWTKDHHLGGEEGGVPVSRNEFPPRESMPQVSRRPESGRDCLICRVQDRNLYSVGVEANVDKCDTIMSRGTPYAPHPTPYTLHPTLNGSL